MRGDLISVIVPVYNGEAYIERCIRSVLYQEYRTWELLLVDGASTDGTLKRCHAWQKKDERIRVISLPENQGVSVGRNAGIRRARGEYLFFWMRTTGLCRTAWDGFIRRSGSRRPI